MLLIALGVGVLIGRAGGASRTSSPSTEVVTVAGTAGAGSVGAGASESFTGDWPPGTSGYTVQLRTLTQSGATVAEVESAESAATAEGASAVGALKSEEFSSLAAGSYVIYSGVYHTRAEAQKALGSLAEKFPAAKVIHVSEGGSGTKGAAGEAGGGSQGTSGSKHPGGPADVKALEHSKGKSYIEKTNNLPNVVSTG